MEVLLRLSFIEVLLLRSMEVVDIKVEFDEGFVVVLIEININEYGFIVVVVVIFEVEFDGGRVKVDWGFVEVDRHFVDVDGGFVRHSSNSTLIIITTTTFAQNLFKH